MNVFFNSQNWIILSLAGFLLSACNQPSRDTSSPPSEEVSITMHEKHRPQFHFSPRENWTNDPNGMVYYDGEYHLFYQHFPDTNFWGPMHWGHAVSRDLTNWEHLPIALYPDSLGYIFSGSAVVDWKNTSGFGKDGHPALVAMFTYHNIELQEKGSDRVESQGIAYSTDKGRTWTKYHANPVLPNPGGSPDMRDPKVFWDDQRGQWVVALAVGDHAELWGSPNLKSWKKLSDFGLTLGNHQGVWECPDLFKLQVEGTQEEKWVFIININPGHVNGGSGTQYFVGTFDGKTFTPDPSFLPYVQDGKAVWMDYGKDNYAGVTWSDEPNSERILIGWMSNWQYANKVPTENWRNAMTLPRALSLHHTGAGYRLFSQPIKELKSLRKKNTVVEATHFSGNLELTDKLGFPATLMEVDIEFAIPKKGQGQFGIEISNARNERYRIGYDIANGDYFSDRTKAGDHSFSSDFAPKLSRAPRTSQNPTIHLHLFLDTSSAELFADDGQTILTELFFPSEAFNQIRLFSVNSEAEVLDGRVYSLKSIWK